MCWGGGEREREKGGGGGGGGGGGQKVFGLDNEEVQIEICNLTHILFFYYY